LQPSGDGTRHVIRQPGVELQRHAPGQGERAAAKLQRTRAGEQIQGSMFSVQCSVFDVCLSETNGTSDIQSRKAGLNIRLAHFCAGIMQLFRA
jgi:hypothetical protein